MVLAIYYSCDLLSIAEMDHRWLRRASCCIAVEPSPHYESTHIYCASQH